eukprot:scaffold18742_cov78-Skeletonema_dohrnii-CCMP3373.AAC.1
MSDPVKSPISLTAQSSQDGEPILTQVQALDLGSCSLLSLHSLHALKGYCGCGDLYSTKRNNKRVVVGCQNCVG